MAYETFEKVEGIIRGINRADSCCSMTVSLISDSNIVNAVVTGETTIIGNVRLRPGMRIAVFYDTNLPTPAIYWIFCSTVASRIGSFSGHNTERGWAAKVTTTDLPPVSAALSIAVRMTF